MLVDAHCSLSRKREREEENSVWGTRFFLASVRSPLVVESGGRHFCEDRTKEHPVEDGVAVDEIPMIGARSTLEIFLTVRIRDISYDW